MLEGQEAGLHPPTPVHRPSLAGAASRSAPDLTCMAKRKQLGGEGRGYDWARKAGTLSPWMRKSAGEERARYLTVTVVQRHSGETRDGRMVPPGSIQ